MTIECQDLFCLFLCEAPLFILERAKTTSWLSWVMLLCQHSDKIHWICVTIKIVCKEDYILPGCTIKKENQTFLIHKKIRNGAVAKSYMRKGFLMYEEMRKYLTIYDEAVSYIWLCNCSILNFLIYEENLIFFFISVSATKTDTSTIF